MLHKPTQEYAELKRTELMFRSLIENPHIGAYAVCEDRFLFVNNKMADMMGYQRDEMIRTLHALDIFAPEERPHVIESRQRRLRGDVSETYSQRRGLRHDGTSIDLEIFGSVIQLDGRRVTLSMVLDITHRKQAEASTRLAEVVYQTTSEAMVIADPQGVICHINPAFTRITGYLEEEVVGQDMCLLDSDLHTDNFYTELWASLQKTGSWAGEVKSQHKNGEYFIKNLRVNTSFDETGQVQYRVGLFSDDTKRKHAEATIWRQANYDFLTDLPNRKMLVRALNEAMRVSTERDQQVAVVFLDLDHFKEVNDLLGHPAGDQLLKQVAQRLAHSIRQGDTVGRMGGDEFMIIMPFANSTEGIEKACKRVLSVFDAPFPIGTESVTITASLGVTLAPGHGGDVTDLFKKADLAMYEAKGKGRNQICWFDSDLQEKAAIRRRLGRELLDALARREFVLMYQPIIDLSSGAIRKAEALIRWNHPSRGLLGPAEFIPFAEHSNAIGSIGDWVFHEASRQVQAWRRAYSPDFQVSINVSPAQFSSKQAELTHWPDLLDRQKSRGLYSVVVEITEGLLMDSTGGVQQQLRSFRNGGLQIALDDFGTGYSSLAYLKKFDIDYIKIDRSFISNLGPETDDRALCDAIIVMAHRLGLKVVAEGIETKQQHELLMLGQCDYGQGYLFGHPMTAANFSRLLEQELHNSKARPN